MRTLYKKGVYTLDHGRGHDVVVVEFTDQFVIHCPVTGGSQVVIDRAGFEEEAIMVTKFVHQFIFFQRQQPDGAITGPHNASNDPTAFDFPVVLDMRRVPDEAFVRGVPG